MTAADPTTSTAHELAAAFRSGATTPTEVTEAILERIDRVDPAMHAFLTVSADEARAAASDADRRIRDDGDAHPLTGVPLSVKDLLDTRGIRTTYGSPLFAEHVPDRDAVLVERLRALDMPVLGKTNTPEFGLLGETRNLLGPECANPRDLTRTVGGSSGGAAAAVAAGLGPLAIGTDGAGSVVTPAAMCGVLGLKPTRGRIPIAIDPATSGIYIDAGIIARSVDDIALALTATAGPDGCDPLSVRERWDPAWRRPVDGLRIASTPDLGVFPVDQQISDAVDAAAGHLTRDGAARADLTLGLPNPWDVYNPLFFADTWAEFGDMAQATPDRFTPDALDEILQCREISADDVVAALPRWWRFRRRVDEIFDEVDALLMPVTATPPFPLSSPPGRINGVEVRKHWTAFMPFGVCWNIAGNPEISVPYGSTADGLPLAVMVVAAAGREDVCLSVAEHLTGGDPIPIAT